MTLGLLTSRLDHNIIREIASYLSLNDLQHLCQTSRHVFVLLSTLQVQTRQVVPYVAGARWRHFVKHFKCKEIIAELIQQQRVHHLDLFDTRVVDVSALGQVHTLDLRFTDVIDVSALGQVHTLIN